VILKDGAKPYAVGDLFRQPRLAALLETLAERGVTAFYTGRVARIIDADMRANGGFLGVEDLADIPWPVERPAINTRYRSCVIASTPPPAAGRALLLVLRILKRFYPTTFDKNKPEVLAVLINTLREVISAHRRNPLPSRDYRPAGDVFLSDERWLQRIMADIRAGAYPSNKRPLSEKTLGETTHLSVMDADGNAVGLTQSVNLVYGSKAACPALGIVYNNYLLDTERRDPNHPHYLKPGAVPQSYACPTIVFHDGRPWMVTGSPGSERIISVVTQFLVHVIDHQRPICEAMQWPRFHCAPEGILSLEYDRFDPALLEYLEGTEVPIERRSPYAFYLGAVHAVLKRQCGRGFQGVAEIRRDGIAAGFDR
jgi:gamma-glutamyltranspeptidase/glutathione hydrolase